MKAWEYNRGTWTEIDDPLSEIQETDWDKIIIWAGYAKEGVYGSEQDYEPSIELYRERATAQKTAITERYPLLLVITLAGDSFESVFLPDFPSVLMFLRDFAPLVQQQGFAYRVQLLEMAIRKGFQAWHEHDLDEICEQCDHEGMRVRRIAREMRLRKQAEMQKAQATKG